MSIALLVYLINLLSSINALAIFVSVGLVFVLVPTMLIAYCEDSRGTFEQLGRIKGLLITTFIIATVCSIVIPSKTDMYIILGLSVAEKVIDSDKGNELFDKSYQLVVDKIDDAIKEKAEEELREQERKK